MDWTTILKAQQTDFIQRLKSGDLLHCEKEGRHSELTVISGERLQQLRDFCWEMAEKYRRTSSNPIRNVFINNLKGKLGEEVVKSRLGRLVTEVDYEKRRGGDGKVDFTLTSDSSIGIQVKARHGNIDTVEWSISREEIEKNVVLVCILIQEEVSEAQTEYNLIIAGFLPTNMIKSSGSQALVGIDELLYTGGLNGYLFNLLLSKIYEYINSGDEHFYKNEYKQAIANFNHALKLYPNYYIAYYKRGITYFNIGDLQNAIKDFTQTININPDDYNAYFMRGFAHGSIGDLQNAIKDFTQAININPDNYNAYYRRGIAHFSLENMENAIKDFTQAININSNDADAYSARGLAHCYQENMENAIKDLTQAININPNDADAYNARGLARCYQRDIQAGINDYQTAADINKKEGNEIEYENILKKINNIIKIEEQF